MDSTPIDTPEAAVNLQYAPGGFVDAQQTAGNSINRVMLISLLVIVAATASNGYMANHEGAMLGLCLLLFIILIRVGCWLIVYPIVARRTFARQPLAQLLMRIAMFPEGLRTESTRGSFTYLWKDFHGWRANAKVVLLYLSPRTYLILPSRLAELGFPLDALRATLTRELGLPRR